MPRPTSPTFNPSADVRRLVALVGWLAAVLALAIASARAEEVRSGGFGTEDGWTRWSAWAPLTYDFNYWAQIPSGGWLSGLRLSSSGQDGNGGAYQPVVLEGGKSYHLMGAMKDLGSSPNCAWLEVWITEREPVNGLDIGDGGTPGTLLVNANTWNCDGFDTSFSAACNTRTTVFQAPRPGLNTYYLAIKAGHYAYGSLDVVVDEVSLAEYGLVWSDEFNGPGIDWSNWSRQVFGGAGNGNNELQFYTDRDENSFVENGNLVIQANREWYADHEYTSARLTSAGKRVFLYGRIEARIKVPAGQGLWPAFWMFPTDGFYGGWSASGELDIMETVNWADLIAGSIHFGASSPGNVHTSTAYSDGRSFADDFHVYAVEWEPTEIRWYIDDIHYATKNSWWCANAPYPAPFNQRFHFILNLAVGGNWPGSPPAWQSFPQRMLVDWVRVYQREAPQWPYNGEPAPVPGRIQAEHYDFGGPTVAFHDSSLANLGNDIGNTLRTGEPVDLGPAADVGGGLSIGWIDWGEWTEYTIDVQEAGVYRLDARVATPNSGQLFAVRFLRDGTEVFAGPATFNSTGGWQAWQTVTVANAFTLPRGIHVMRFEPWTKDFNVNYFDLILVESHEPPTIAELVDYLLGSGPQPPNADRNGDGAIDIADLVMLAR